MIKIQNKGSKKDTEERFSSTSRKSLMELYGRWRKGLSGKNYLKKVRYSDN